MFIVGFGESNPERRGRSFTLSRALCIGLTVTVLASTVVHKIAAQAPGTPASGSGRDIRSIRAGLSAEAGAGVRLDLHSSWGIEIGFKLHHLSNTGTGEVNLGLDSKVFYVGFTTS